MQCHHDRYDAQRGYFSGRRVARPVRIRMRVAPRHSGRSSRSVMKPLEKVILAAGFILAFAAGLSLLYCVVLVGSAVSKGYRLLEFVGYWPLYTIVLLLLSGCFILGAEPLARAIGKKKSDEDKSG